MAHRKPPKKVSGDPPLQRLLQLYGEAGVRDLAERGALPPQAAATLATVGEFNQGRRPPHTLPENALHGR